VSIAARIFTGLCLLFAAGLFIIFYSVVNDVRPRYFEAVEESMIDMVQVAASLIEADVKNEKINITRLDSVLDRAYTRSFSARIFFYEKKRVSVWFYVCDKNGIVIYDSKNNERLGEDYSQWNDVYLTLHGKYGARSSGKDESSAGLLYVGAPIYFNGKVIGSVTVEKPKESVGFFIALARKKIIMTGVVSFIAFIIIGYFMSIWVTSPVKKLTEYVRGLSGDGKPRRPPVSGREIADLSRAFDSLWEELRGKKYIEEYIQKLTHELKSPLASIRGSLELLFEDIPDDQRVRFLSTMHRETKRMESVIEKMLLLSDVENRGELEGITTIHLLKLVEDVCESLGPQIRQKDISINITIDNDLSVEGDHFLLRHALLNIIDNALRFSPEKGAIDIAAYQSEQQTAITISDDGSGIPANAQAHIFERFFSLPAAPGERRGTGLGLSFVREAVLLHGGTVSIENIPSGGACVTVILPLLQKKL
jgi:two-component system, OmpR family, sensor histidine kinase CreC